MTNLELQVLADVYPPRMRTTKKLQQFSSPTFEMGDVAKMMSALESIRSKVKRDGMSDIERMGHPQGTHVMYLEDKIRLVIQYDALRDVSMGRFDVLGLVDA